MSALAVKQLAVMAVSEGSVGTWYKTTFSNRVLIWIYVMENQKNFYWHILFEYITNNTFLDIVMNCIIYKVVNLGEGWILEITVIILSRSCSYLIISLQNADGVYRYMLGCLHYLFEIFFLEVKHVCKWKHYCR